MLYRGEIIADNRVKGAKNFQATHPKQVIRQILLMAKHTNLEFMQVYVMNEQGQIWVYNIRRYAGDTFKANIITKTSKLVPQNVSNAIFAGNKLIREVL